VQITQVKVVNHSRIRDLQLDVRRHAVIVGANDVGKTSLLRLLQFLLGSSTGQLFQGLSRADIADGGAEMVVQATLGQFTDPERTLFPREISIDAEDKTESLTIQLVVGADPDDADAVTIRRWFPEAGHDRAPTREQMLAFGWRYLPATRVASASSLDGPNSALQALLQAIDLGAEKVRLTGLLDNFNTELASSSRLASLREDVACHLSRAMPRSITDEDLAVRTAADPAGDVLSHVSMFFHRDGEYVPVTDQSDGLRQLMSMTLFDLAEGAANVVAIDEPELHLHPASQRTVAELLGGTTNQKILVTHSPYIVQRFEPAQIIAVSPDGVCHQIAVGNLSAVNKQRASWWSPRLLEALTARLVIIVEGVSDRVIVERAAMLMGISLDRLGAMVFEIDGADKFPHVYKLLGKPGFCVPVLGLVDEAEKMRWHGQIGGRPSVVFGTTLFASNPDLEAEYCHALTGPGGARALITAGFCTEQGIVSSCGVIGIGDVTAEKLADYCRKDKVGAAVAMASQLDPASAARIKSVHSLLCALQASSPNDD
jgi:putative ATP-dependent endonuclease of the OLD family